MNSAYVLAERIARMLRQGLVLSEQTCEFMESMFGGASPEVLKKILQDEEEPGRESLLELIFFPDEPCQVLLEDLLIAERCADPAPVVRELCRMSPEVHLIFPDQPHPVAVNLTEDLAAGFVSRLRILNHPDPGLVQAVRDHVRPEDVAPVLVKIRNTDLPASRHILRFVCLFFSRMNSGTPDFPEDVDFILRFASGLHHTVDIFRALMDRRKRLQHAVEKAESYQKQLARYNMEVMILKGSRNPCIQVEDVRRTIARIDRICMTLFGRCWYPEPSEEWIDLGGCSSKQELDKVFRMLS